MGRADHIALAAALSDVNRSSLTRNNTIVPGGALDLSSTGSVLGGLVIALLLTTLLSLPTVATAEEGDLYMKKRHTLVDIIEDDVKDTRRYLGKGQLDERVLEAIRSVPRHLFVPDDSLQSAYENRPLPIGHGQTISQPYIVAIMTDLINPEEEDRILEIGTGSGYQAAVLATLTDQVFSMEIVEPLGIQAKERLEKLGYNNVRVRVGDGYYGWKEEAPFDAIVVTAAAHMVPPPLIRQLKRGGRMIIPVGSSFMVQQLVLIEKDQAGEVSLKQILPVRFVPLTGGER